MPALWAVCGVFPGRHGANRPLPNVCRRFHFDALPAVPTNRLASAVTANSTCVISRNSAINPLRAACGTEVTSAYFGLDLAQVNTRASITSIGNAGTAVILTEVASHIPGSDSPAESIPSAGIDCGNGTFGPVCLESASAGSCGAFHACPGGNPTLTTSARDTTTSSDTEASQRRLVGSRTTNAGICASTSLERSGTPAGQKNQTIATAGSSGRRI